MTKEHISIHGRRIWEIDCMRGIAIILMTLFHVVYDLKEFAGVSIDHSALSWSAVGKSAAILFLLLAGISTNLSKSIFSHGVKVFFVGHGPYRDNLFCG